MKKILFISIIFSWFLPVVMPDTSTVLAQNRYSIDQKVEKRKQRRTRQERYEDRQVKKAQQKKERLAKQRERQHRRALKRYRKKVSGGGTDMVTNKKVHRRMKKSLREARKNNNRGEPFWKRWFSRKNKP
jgi:biopolymer transport protein ExbB/TolQ